MGVLIGLVLGLAAGPATIAMAAPGDTTWVRTNYMYLTPTPVDSMHTVCSSRHLYLAGAKGYAWSIKLVGQRAGSSQGLTGRYIDLGTGEYEWKVCIDPKDGHYVMYTELDPDYPPWRTIRMTSHGFKLAPAQDHYAAYSFLDPPF